MKPKLTKWFEPGTKPVRVGVYQTKFFSDDIGYSYWNGKEWCWQKDTLAEASKNRVTFGSFQKKPWRGLAEKPK